jgi:hypothetical protein
MSFFIPANELQLIKSIIMMKIQSSCNGQSPKAKACHPGVNASSLEELIRSYENGRWMNDCVKHTQAQRSSLEAIKTATGKSNHQKRIVPARLIEFAERLIENHIAISNAKNFDELIRIVQEKGNEIKGIGTLAVYDISLRIGAYLGFEPEKIYIHAGTKVGAINLLGNENVKGRHTFEKEVFVTKCAAFQELCPADIENFLCINKKKLKQHSNL